jgi:pimeloyl-ACP methyl ester carboxylesterase
MLAGCVSGFALAEVAQHLWGISSLKEVQKVSMARLPGWKRRTLRALIIALSIYLALFALLLVFEDRLLFRPISEKEHWKAPPQSWTNLQDVWLDCEGVRIHAWWLVPKGWERGKGAALFFHGNGGNISNCGHVLDSWNQERGEGILAIDYPGYGKSQGNPSEMGCYAAARSAYAWLTNEQGIPGDRIILIGQSLGTAVATNLAADLPHRSLVLLSPFTSMPDMAAKQFPIFPGRWFIHNRFDNLERIGRCRRPLFIVHGTNDDLVPFEHSEKLFAAANTPKQLHALDEAGHHISLNDSFYGAFRAFLRDSELDRDEP